MLTVFLPVCMQVTVRTSIGTLQGYLDHLMSITNMRCLTPAGALTGECDYLAANLYAKSVFGEDALANLSIEKGADGQVRYLGTPGRWRARIQPTYANLPSLLRPSPTAEIPQVTGHVRIRSKTQGIALSLGDKITLSQKGEGTSFSE